MCPNQVRLIYSLKFAACVVQVEATMTIIKYVRSASGVQAGADGLVLPDELVEEKLYCTDVVH